MQAQHLHRRLSPGQQQERRSRSTDSANRPRRKSYDAELPRWQLHLQFPSRTDSLKHVVSNDYHECQIRMITDSKSAHQRCESITSDPRPNSWLERELLNSLKFLAERQVGIVFLWCHSHWGLWGNEEADRCAAEASAMSKDNIPWTYHSAQAKIRRRIKK